MTDFQGTLVCCLGDGTLGFDDVDCGITGTPTASPVKTPTILAADIEGDSRVGLTRVVVPLGVIFMVGVVFGVHRFWRSKSTAAEHKQSEQQMAVLS